MAAKCCKAYIWPNGIFFSEETYSWDDVRRNATQVQELKYMPGWYPWNVIYRVTSERGGEETYATFQNIANRNYQSWYKRNRAKGLCVRCSRPTGNKYCMCNACRAKHREAEQRRKREKEEQQQRGD